MEHEKKHIKQNVNPENNGSKQQLDIQRRLFIKYFFMKYIFLILLSGCRLKCTCLITSH